MFIGSIVHSVISAKATMFIGFIVHAVISAKATVCL